MIGVRRRTPRWIEEQIEMSEYIGKRKHSSQLTEDELESLHGRLKDVVEWNLTYHALDRLDEKGINATYEDIVSTIFNCEIIEYKIDYNERINRCQERIVVRSNALTNGDYNLNVVFSLSDSYVITVWLNHVDDRHDTLDWSLYDEDMKVFGVA